MSKNKIHIDKFFRRQLQGMQMPVGPGSWQAMQASLAAARKRRRRLLWLWWAGAALLVGALAGTYMLAGNDTENPTAQNKTIEQNTYKGRETTTGRAESNVKIEGETAQTPTGQNPAQLQSNAETDVQAGQKTNVAPAQPAKTVKPQSNTPKPAPQNKKPGTGKTTPQTDENTTGKGTTAQPATEMPDKPVADAGQKDGANGATLNRELPVAPADNVKPKTDEPVKVAAVAPTDSSNTTKKDADTNKDKTVKDKGPGKAAQGLQWYYGAKAAGMNTQYNITSPNQHIDSIYNYGKNAGLSYSFTFEGGLKLGNWTFGSGLGYAAYTKNSDFYFRKNIYDSVPVKNPQGQIIGYFHTNFRDTLMQRGLHSRTHYVNIPVSATYHINIGQKLSLSLGANATVNINAGTGGQDVNPYNLNVVKASTLQSAARTFMFSAGAQAGLQYMQGNTAIFANFTYSRALTGMYVHDYLLAQRPRSIGLEAGIRFFIVK